MLPSQPLLPLPILPTPAMLLLIDSNRNELVEKALDRRNPAEEPLLMVAIVLTVFRRIGVDTELVGIYDLPVVY